MSRLDTDSIWVNRHDPAHLFLQGAPRQAPWPVPQRRGIPRRPVQVEGRPLGQVANAPLGLGRILKDIVSPHRDLPLRGRQAACHNVHGGGFPRAIGAEKAIDLSCFNVKRQIGHGGMGAIPLGEIFTSIKKVPPFPVHWVRRPVASYGSGGSLTEPKNFHEQDVKDVLDLTVIPLYNIIIQDNFVRR